MSQIILAFGSSYLIQFQPLDELLEKMEKSKSRVGQGGCPPLNLADPSTSGNFKMQVKRGPQRLAPFYLLGSVPLY